VELTEFPEPPELNPNPTEDDPKDDPSELDPKEDPPELDPKDEPPVLELNEDPPEVDPKLDPNEEPSEFDPNKDPDPPDELDPKEEPPEIDPKDDPPELEPNEDPPEVDPKLELELEPENVLEEIPAKEFDTEEDNEFEDDRPDSKSWKLVPNEEDPPDEVPENVFDEGDEPKDDDAPLPDEEEAVGFPIIVWKCDGWKPPDDDPEDWNPPDDFDGCNPPDDDAEKVDDGFNTEDVGDP